MKPRFAEPITDFMKWFAWRPVNTWDYGWVWLRPVYKRRCQPHEYLHNAGGWWWQYVKFLPTKEEI